MSTSMHYQSYVFIIAITFLVPTDAQVPEDGPPVECRPGSHMNNVSGQCVYCVAGRDFTDVHNRLDSCSPCATCTGGRLIKSECTISRNTICVCPDDHYEHADGCSPRQGEMPRSPNDVIAELQLQNSNAIKNFSLSVEQVFNNLSAQLRTHSEETRNLSLTVDIISHWIVGLEKDLIAGSQSQKNDHVAIKALVSVLIPFVVIFTVVILLLILKNRQHARGDSGSGPQPQQQPRLGERASSMFRSLCFCIRPTSATDKREVVIQYDNPPPDQSETTINSSIGPQQTSLPSATGSSTSTSQADAGGRKKVEDAAPVVGEHDDIRMSPNKQEMRVVLDGAGADCGGAAAPYGKTATDNPAEESPTVNDGPHDAQPLLDQSRTEGRGPRMSTGL